MAEKHFISGHLFHPQKYLSPILGMIGRAQKYVYISVMDYYAALIYHKPRPKYWDKIDRALRAAVFDRGVTVHLLTSKWNSTRQQVGFVFVFLNRGANHSLEISGNPYMKSEISYARAKNPK